MLVGLVYFGRALLKDIQDSLDDDGTDEGLPALANEITLRAA